MESVLESLRRPALHTLELSQSPNRTGNVPSYTSGRRAAEVAARVSRLEELLRDA